MKKEEIIHLHVLLVHFKKFYEDSDPGCNFKKYNELGITPFQVHLSKEEHKQAIFILVTELVSMMHSCRGGYRKSEEERVSDK